VSRESRRRSLVAILVGVPLLVAVLYLASVNLP